MTSPLIVIACLALLLSLLNDPAPGVTRLALAAASIVGPAMTIDAGRALYPIEVDGLGSLRLGRGPTTLRHLDRHDHQRVVLVMCMTTVVHNWLEQLGVPVGLFSIRIL